MNDEKTEVPNVTGKTVYGCVRIEDNPIRKSVTIAFTDGSELTVSALDAIDVTLSSPRILTDVERGIMRVGQSLTTEQIPRLLAALEPIQQVQLVEVLRNLMEMSRREP